MEPNAQPVPSLPPTPVVMPVPAAAPVPFTQIPSLPPQGVTEEADHSRRNILLFIVLLFLIVGGVVVLSPFHNQNTTTDVPTKAEASMETRDLLRQNAVTDIAVLLNTYHKTNGSYP